MIFLFLIQLSLSAFSILYWVGFQDIVHYQLAPIIRHELNLLVILININMFLILGEIIITLIFITFKNSFKKLVVVFIILKFIMALPLFLYIITGKMIISYETQFFILMSEGESIITYFILNNKKDKPIIR